MKTRVKVTETIAHQHKLSMFMTFGTRGMRIAVDKPYTTIRAARRAAATIAKKFGLDITTK